MNNFSLESEEFSNQAIAIDNLSLPEKIALIAHIQTEFPHAVISLIDASSGRGVNADDLEKRLVKLESEGKLSSRIIRNIRDILLEYGELLFDEASQHLKEEIVELTLNSRRVYDFTSGLRQILERQHDSRAYRNFDNFGAISFSVFKQMVKDLLAEKVKTDESGESNPPLNNE